MTARDLFKRTPFRLAATFTVLFTSAVLGLFVLLYVALKAELASNMRSRVDATLDAMADVDSDRGFQDLVEVVESESKSIRDSGMIYLLVDGSGKYRAGNVREVKFAPGFLQLPRKKLPSIADSGDPAEVFLARWRPVSDGTLLVGVSDREILQIETLILRNALRGLAVTTFIAVLFGALLAYRAQQRIYAISNTLDEVAQGRLDARIRLSQSEDDIDHISHRINKTVGKLATLVAGVNQTSTDIAHDLKKPMSALHQKLDRARRLAREPDEFRGVIDDALVDLKSIFETFEALLRITQIEAGARKARFTRLDLATVLIDIAEVYEPVAGDLGHEFSVKVDPYVGAPISGDRELLVQLFANLIENAIRHTPEGTSIWVALEETDASWRATIADSGPGIPEYERCNVFRRLYRLEAARTTPGNGLGLSLVAAIAELHEATVELVDNKPGLKVVVTFARAAA